MCKYVYIDLVYASILSIRSATIQCCCVWDISRPSCQHCRWELCRHPVTSTGRGSLIDDLPGDPKTDGFPLLESDWCFGVAYFQKLSLQKGPQQNYILLIKGHWKEKSDEKWMAQLWLGQVKFGSEYFGCSTQTADWKPKLLSKHLQTVLQRSKIHLRSWSCRPTHLSIRPQGSIGEDRLWSTPKAKRRGPLHLRIDTQENVGRKALVVIWSE